MTENIATAAHSILSLSHDAEALAANAEAGMPQHLGTLAQIEALLAGATTLATETARMASDFTGPLPADLTAPVRDAAHRMALAAGTIRDAAPLDSALNAAYQAAYTLLYQAAQPVYRATA